MKNPLANTWTMMRVWRDMRRYPGVFPLRDALLHARRALLPARLHYRMAAEMLADRTRTETLPDGTAQVRVPEADLTFFWPGKPETHLWYLIEQELSPRDPHHYTTSPIRLAKESVVLDVGACEGLFAFRILRCGWAGKVVCFEPDPQMAALIRRGAEANGVGQGIVVEAVAVAARTGEVLFAAEGGAEASRIVDAGSGSATQGKAPRRVPAVTLDDYCRQHGVTLTARDLIKIDAEGADHEVLRGAAELIRERAPQIAVTTYHTAEHYREILEWLREVQPRYRFRLKGFAHWTPKPRPVLLQASTLDG
jgi:FkbM family methyltransferase